MTLAVLLMGPFMAQADATIANVATPSIRDDLGASSAALELVVGGYMIAFAVLLITGARLGQTHGYRRVFVLGVTTFTVASALCGLAPTPAVLIAARVLQGAGAALMFPQTLTGIQLSFEGAERARAIGLYAIALSSGAVAGQILGGRPRSRSPAPTGARSSWSTFPSAPPWRLPPRASCPPTTSARPGRSTSAALRRCRRRSC